MNVDVAVDADLRESTLTKTLRIRLTRRWPMLQKLIRYHEAAFFFFFFSFFEALFPRLAFIIWPH